MAKILLAGEIMAEKQYLVDRVPLAKEVCFANKVNYLTSSKIINAGRVLAKNNSVSMSGAIGNDKDGEQALVDLKKYGIDPKLVYKVKDPTGQVLVLTNRDGQSAIVLHLGAVVSFSNKKLKNLSAFNWLYMATSMDLKQMYEMIKRGNKDKVKVYIDFPNQQKEFDKTKLKTVDFIVPNRQEAEILLNTKIKTIEDALKACEKLKSYTDGNVVITLDEDGCVAFGKDWDNPKHFPTKKEKVVDATGSGDIFRGALLNEYIKTNNLKKSIKIALEIATKSVSFLGVDNSINKSI